MMTTETGSVMPPQGAANEGTPILPSLRLQQLGFELGKVQFQPIGTLGVTLTDSLNCPVPIQHPKFLKGFGHDASGAGRIRQQQYEAEHRHRPVPTCPPQCLPDHKRGEEVLLGRDPDDFNAPALAWNAKNELICEGIQPVVRGAYGSVDGIRQAATNRKAAREAVSAAAAANNYLSDADLKAALAAIPTPGAPTPAPAAVVAGQFSGSLKQCKRGNAPAVVEDEEIDLVRQLARGRKFLTEEHLQNLDKAAARKQGLA